MSGSCPVSERDSSHADAYERYLCLMFSGEIFILVLLFLF